ncbi:MAG: glycogen synthase [Geoalkalibacter sp.]|jgi:starch synthase|uniref:glycogen synthase n=1 Tax=Geoalkalibacter sp. TaxID=3041440 RepID=UPI002A9EAD33|nr:glycogen/starch synthase [Thermodesulfobacteriota bacterium]
MQILIVSPEVHPYAKHGELAEVAGALGKALRKLGHDARIILPCYKEVDDNGFTLRKGRKSVEVMIEGQTHKGLLRQTMLEGVPVYFIENREFFHREGLYGEGGQPYKDNAQRFAFFGHAVLQLLRRMDFRPDVLHLHGWQTGLIPVLLRTTLKNDPFYAPIHTVFTFRDLDEGRFSPSLFESLHLNVEADQNYGLNHQGRFSFLAGALTYADIVTTISPTYRNELRLTDLGTDFAPLLRQRGSAFHGILEGLDTKTWDPSLDMNLNLPYNVDNLNGKKGDKRALQKEMELEPEALIPLVGAAFPLTCAKGADLIKDAWEQLMQRELQLVIAGEAAPGLHDFFAERQDRHDPKTRVLLTQDTGIARRIFAGSDIFLMPSRHEAFGPEQIIALRYGSVPVAHRSGGISDTVIDADEHPRQGNGFLFEEATPDAMLKSLDRALEVYRNRRQWLKIVKRGMTEDFTWQNCAQKYVDIYRKAMAYRPV